MGISALSTGASTPSFPASLHSLSSCDAHSFLTHPPLPNVLGRSTGDYIRPFHHMPSRGNRPTRLRPCISPLCMERSLVVPPSRRLCASTRSHSAHTAHLFSRARSQPYFRPSVFTAFVSIRCTSGTVQLEPHRRPSMVHPLLCVCF